MSVCLSSYIIVAPGERILVKFGIKGLFCENLLTKYEIC